MTNTEQTYSCDCGQGASKCTYCRIAELQNKLQETKAKLDFVINNYAFIMEQTADTERPTYQLWTQNEDEEYIVLHDKDKFFPTKLEAVEAAMLSAAQKE